MSNVKKNKKNHSVSPSSKSEQNIVWLASFPELNPNPVIEITAGGRFTYINPAAEKLFPDLKKLDFKHPFLSKLGALLKKIKKTGQGFSRDVYVDNRWFGQQLFYIPKNKRFRIYSHDITHRKLLEEHNFRIAKEWQTTFDSIEDAICLIDENHVIKRINRAFTELVKMKKEKIIGKHCYEVVHGLKSPVPSCPHVKTLNTSKAVTEEFIEPRLGIYIEATTSPVFNKTNKCVGSIHIIKSIHERKLAEEQIKKSEERLNRAEKIANLGSWELDIPKNKLTWSDETYRIFGLKPRGFRATYEAFLKAVHPDDRNAVNDAYFNSIKEGKNYYEIEHKILRKSGEIRYVHEKCEHIRNASGKIIKSIGMVHDITERRTAESSLLESEERFRMVLENSLDAAYRWNFKKGQFDYASPVIEKISGLTDKEYQRMKPNEIETRMHPDDLERAKKELAIAVQGKQDSGTIEYRYLRKDGKYVWISNRYSIIRDKYGYPLYRVGIVRDITREKEIDKAKTEFISLTAHQLRTPLATLSLSSEMLLRGLGGKLEEDGEYCLKEIFNNVHEMKDMVELFLNVSRIEMGSLSIEPNPLDVLEIAEKMVKIVSPQIKEKELKLKTDFEKLPIINVDPKILHIAIENLLSNAIKYTPKGGKINFKIKKTQNDAVFQISDSGCGIPKEEQKKMFTKLFRASNTKAEGIGLGLYLVKNLIEQSGGKITFESEEKKGSTFYITVPLSGMLKKKIILADNQ